MHNRICFGLALGFASTAGIAQAQYPPPPPPPAGYGYGAPVMAPPVHRFGSAGQLVISSDANLGLTGRSTGGVNGSPGSSGWNLTLTPAADYFVIPNLSIGGFLNYIHDETSNPATTNGAGITTASSSISENTFGIGARVGYNIPITDWISFWPKAGLSFGTTSFSGGGGGGGSTNAFNLNIFAPFLYHLASHFFVGLGPVLNANLTASESNNGTSGDAPKTVTYGLAFTVGGWMLP